MRKSMTAGCCPRLKNWVWALVLVAGIGGALLACGNDSEDRFLRQHARSLVDPNSDLYRREVSSRVGTAPLSAAVAERRLRQQLERGVITLNELRSDHARYCE